MKLWQFDPSDRTRVRIDTTSRTFSPDPNRTGVETMPLFADAFENVRLERWTPGASVELNLPGGGEFLVLDGGFEDRGDSLVSQSWLRLPAGERLMATAGPAGCKLWIKTGHLAGCLTMPRLSGNHYLKRRQISGTQLRNH